MHDRAQYRNLCYTSYRNFTIPHESDGVLFWLAQKEKCPTTGRLHMQGYLRLSKPWRRKRIQTLLQDSTAHLETIGGTHEDNVLYCTKAETRVEGGGPWQIGNHTNNAGKRSDLTDLVDSLTNNTRVEDIVDTHPVAFIKFSKGIKELLFHRSLKKAKTFRHVLTTIRWGTTGSGKTRTAIATTPDFFKLDTGDGNCWFDGYTGEDHLIIDDFYGWIKFGMLLNLLDGHPMRLPIKGSHVWANWTKVTITSNKEPSRWYKDLTTEQEAAFWRRITIVLHYTEHEGILDTSRLYKRPPVGQWGGPLTLTPNLNLEPEAGEMLFPSPPFTPDAFNDLFEEKYPDE